MRLVQDIVVKKHIAIQENDSLSFAIEMMCKSGQGAIVIVTNGKAIGILTERDIVSIINYDMDINKSIKSFFKFHRTITINEKRTLEYALHVLIDNSIRRLVVIDDMNRFVGLITQSSLLQHLDEDVFKTSLLVSSFIDHDIKLISLNQSLPIAKAFETMNEMSIGSIVAVDDNDKPVGILTERDSINILKEHQDINLPISNVMSSPIISIYENDYVKDVVELMNDHKIRRVLVLDSETNKALTILTTRDIAYNLKGNYTKILESKLKNIKKTLNYMGESILEVFEDNSEYIIQWMNDIAKENFGNIVDESLLRLINEESWAEIHSSIKSDTEPSKYKVKIKEMYFELVCSQHFVNNKETLLLVLRDTSMFENSISDVKDINLNLEQQVQSEIEKNQKHELLMFQQSRLAQMGEMISMIAHQWRQPLNNLSILTQTIFFRYKRGKVDDELMTEFNQDSKKQIKQMSKTIDDFRDFFSPEKEKINFSVNKSINQTIELLKPIFHKQNIKIKFEEIEELEFLGYPNEFSQSLVNIFNNSKDALIEHAIENKNICIKLQLIDEKIVLEVRDNAGGIPKNIINKVFNPYFSTKNEKNGTGLGLYMTKLIIENHMQGKVSVSNGEKGAVFKIIL